MPAEPAYAANMSQEVVIDGTTIRSDDKDTVLVIRLIQVETGETPRSRLQKYSPTLDV